MRKLIFAVLVLYCSIVKAQALYKVSSPEGNGVFSVGSGTAIAENIIVTNSHVVNHTADRVVYIAGGDPGISYSGKVLAVNDQYDLAIIKVDGLLKRIAHLGRGPLVGQTVILRGISSGTTKTKVIQSNAYMDKGFKVKVVELQCACVPGDSGGGVYDEEGNLVAINWGCSPVEYGHNANSTSVDYLIDWIPVVETSCGPLGCTVCQPKQQVAITGGDRRQVYIKPNNPQLPPNQPPLVNIDEDKIADKVYAKIILNIDKFRGPAGINGLNGKDGINGKDGADGFTPEVNLSQYVTITQLNEALAKISANQGHPLTLPVQSINKAGEVVQEDVIPLDGQHALQLIVK